MDHKKLAACCVEKNMLFFQKALAELHTVFTLISTGQVDFFGERNKLFRLLHIIEEQGLSISKICQSLPGHTSWTVEKGRKRNRKRHTPYTIPNAAKKMSK